ncbi:unnamed protein product, partial [Discosporangium mesarthrocarpum]
MLYAGMWRSMFAFHVEDVNLYSINYLHRGDPKSWYCVPPRERRRFEALAAGFFPEEFGRCSEHLRHKTTLMSPNRLKDAGITLYTAVQEAGEFMITFPASYHGGFNHGFNVAESTNFAVDRWIQEGKGAGFCRCRPHSVRIDVDRFEALVRQHRKVAGVSASCLDGLAEGSRRHRGGSGGTSKGGSCVHKKLSARPGSKDGRGKERKGGEGKDSVDSEGNSSCSSGTDDNDDKVRTFRCLCGVRASSDTPLATPWPRGEHLECPRCGVWSHARCALSVLQGNPVVVAGEGGATAQVPQEAVDRVGLRPGLGPGMGVGLGRRGRKGARVKGEAAAGAGEAQSAPTYPRRSPG